MEIKQEPLDIIDLTEEDDETSQEPFLFEITQTSSCHKSHVLNLHKGRRTVVFCSDCKVQVCPVCSCNFSGTLKEHFTQGISQQCTKCSSELPSSCAFKAHMKLHEESEGFFVCPDCGLFLRGARSFIKHSTDPCVHLFRRSEFVCELCSHVSFESVDKYHGHVQTHIVCRFECKDCFSYFDEQKTLQTHFRTVHGLMDKISQTLFDVKFFCQYCEASVVNNHWRFHANNNSRTIFQCSCNSKFRSIPKFRLHWETCPRKGALPEIWAHLSKAPQKQSTRVPAATACDCKDHWLYENNCSVCKNCFAVSYPATSEPQTLQIADDPSWLGAEQIENERKKEVPIFTTLDYSHLPADHNYCLKTDLTFSIIKCKRMQEKANSSQVDRKVVEKPEKKKQPPYVKMMDSCFICKTRIPILNHRKVLEHFQAFHGNCALTSQAKCRSLLMQRSRNRLSQLAGKSVEETVTRENGNEEMDVAEEGSVEIMLMEPSGEDNGENSTFVEEPEVNVTAESPPDENVTVEEPVVNGSVEEEPNGLEDLPNNSITPKKRKKRPLREKKEKTKENEFWDKINDALSVSRKASKENAMDLLNEIHPEKRVVKKPKRLFDEMVENSQYLSGLSEEDLKKKRKRESNRMSEKRKGSETVTDDSTVENNEEQIPSPKPSENNTIVQTEKSKFSMLTRTVCELCKVDFDSNEDYRKHLVQHRTPGRDFQCIDCGECFAMSSHLKGHLITFHEVAPADCEKYISKHKCDQTEQVQTDSQENKSPKCTKCSAKFSKMDELQLHFRSHGLAYIQEKILAASVL